MDDNHFDGLARIVASGGTRRAALRVLGGSALAAGLARLGLGAAAAGPVGIADDRDANCRGSCAQCSGDGQCCSGRCKDGACQCKPRGSCAHDRACCSRRCRSDGRCKRAPDPGCDGGTCPNPASVCKDDRPACDTSQQGFPCTCVPTSSGGSFCASFLVCNVGAPTCRTDKDCGDAGEVCVPPAATKGCRPKCGGNGNACAVPCEDSGTRALAAAEREGWVTFRAGDR